MDKAVILAAGLGLRMRRSVGAGLNAEQDVIAGTGVKAMIPLDNKRPFLDYVLSELAGAGFRRICIVIGPGSEFNQLRKYYYELETERLIISFAIQKEPKGTANAIAASESFAGSEPFVVINSDNFYPMEALKKLKTINTSGTVAFESSSLVKGGNIPAERIARFAILEPDTDFNLGRIVEKPSDDYMKALKGKIYVSMNCWKFSPSIFEACRMIKPSARGEYEIASAVSYAIINLGETFKMIPVELPVLDMTGRSDVSSVEVILGRKEVRF